MEKPFTLLILCILLPLIQSCSLVQPQRPITEKQGKPYLGIAYSELASERGLKITRLLPGPFEQAIFGNLDFDFEHHRLVQINDITVSAKNFQETISKFLPGQTISLFFKKNNDKLEKQIIVDVILGNEFDWTGPIKKINSKKQTDKRYTYLPDLDTGNPFINLIHHEINNTQLNKEVNNLYTLFDDWQLNNQGFNTLSRVTFPFKYPEKLIELESTITTPIAELNKKPEIIFNEIAKNLDLQLPNIDSCSKDYSWNLLTNLVLQSNSLLHKAFINFDSVTIKSKSNDLYYFLTKYFRLSNRQLEPIESLNALNMSLELDFNSLLSSATILHCLINKNITISLSNDDKKISATPHEIKKSINGKIKKQLNKMAYGSFMEAKMIIPMTCL